MEESASELYERQCKYDRLHHLKRIEWLDALPRPLSDFQTYLLKQSMRCIACRHDAYRSVDLDDVDYLRELDEFANKGATQNAQPQE